MTTKVNPKKNISTAYREKVEVKQGIPLLWDNPPPQLGEVVAEPLASCARVWIRPPVSPLV